MSDGRTEPLLHTHITDGLPETHRLAYETVSCGSCGAMVHAVNNECMRAWVETGLGPFCLECFVEATDGAVGDEWGLYVARRDV